MGFVLALASHLLAIAPWLVAGTVVEALLPNAPPTRHRSVILNLGCTVIFWAFHLAAGASLWLWTAETAARLPGAGLLSLPLGSSIQSMAAFLLFSIVLRDGLYYAFHRLQHASPWLWAEHELHHADEHLNVTSAWRHHWLEYLLQAFFIVGPFAYLCRVPPISMLLAFLLSEGQVYYVHLNVRAGWASWLFASPQSHRIHHSREPQHRDKNFAVLFPVWDVLFGTYYAPAPGEYPPTGVPGVRIDTLWEAAIWPFRRWTHAIRRSVRSASGSSSPRSARF